LQRANETRTLIKEIWERQSQFLGHRPIIRKEQIEERTHTVITPLRVQFLGRGPGETTGKDCGWFGKLAGGVGIH
jgi:hypothetical protein